MFIIIHFISADEKHDKNRSIKNILKCNLYYDSIYYNQTMNSYRLV